MFLLIIVIATWHAAKAIDVNILLRSLTLEEKVGQMSQIDIGTFFDSSTLTVDYEKMNSWISNYNIGSVLNSVFSGDSKMNGLVGWNASQWRVFINKLQAMAQTSSSKIPVIYGIDSIHGATYIYGSALFPQAIGLAATFDVDRAVQAGQITSKDTRAAGIPWLFSPVLGLALQPLWSRFEETFGEDPYLAAQMGSSLINGIQRESSDGGVPRRAAACMKHFIAYSDPEDGHDRSPVLLYDRVMQQLYRPAFQAAINAGVMTAMESYQEVGGVPMVSSSQYLKSLLRNPSQMNFTGMMVTDYSEIINLNTWHMVSATIKDAVSLAMQDTSIDMSMVPSDLSFTNYLMELVQEGVIPMSRIDESVKRILQLKADLGLFEVPVPSIADSLLETVGQDSDWEASLDTARDSITLLKNEGVILPLSRSSKIFVTGPTCDSLASQSGSWTFHWQGASSNDEFTRGVTILQGVQQAFGQENVLYNAGPSVYASDISAVNMSAVHDAALKSDVIVACVGEGTYAEKPGDIDDLSLPGGQVQFVQALQATGVPVVLVIVSGRPRLLHGCAELSSAVLETYCPGPMGGQAIGEVLAGTVVPSGRLPFSYPKNAGDLPYPYHHKPSDQCVSVAGKYQNCQVEWPFGAGLSYTSFAYSPILLNTGEINENGKISVSATVVNTGAVAGKHTVLLFLFDIYRRVTPEYKLLKRFTKVTLNPGESIDVSWTLDYNDLQYIGLDSRYVLESGEFRLGLGHEVDCRANPENCTSFALTLSSSYSPVCNAACSLWSSGVCGNFVSYHQCKKTCAAQGWSWNYVDCLENAMDGTCPSTLQCYSAFGTSEPDDDPLAGNSKYVTKSTMYILIAFSAVLGAALAIIAVVILYRREKRSRKLIHNPLFGDDSQEDDETSSKASSYYSPHHAWSFFSSEQN